VVVANGVEIFNTEQYKLSKNQYGLNKKTLMIGVNLLLSIQKLLPNACDKHQNLVFGKLKSIIKLILID
jgi:maltose-binding protein MalE